MSINPFLRDPGEQLLKLIQGIADREGPYKGKARDYGEDLSDALKREDETGARDAVCKIYLLLAFVDFATDEEFRHGEELKHMFPDDLKARIDEERKDRPNDVGSVISMKTADQFTGEPMRFVWYPFIPCGEYSIMAAAGGSGKGMAACLIAAYISKGIPLPGVSRRFIKGAYSRQGFIDRA